MSVRLSSTLYWRRCPSPDIYVKVALFEGKRVIKAKKTRMLACEDLLEFQVLAALQCTTAGGNHLHSDMKNYICFTPSQF